MASPTKYTSWYAMEQIITFDGTPFVVFQKYALYYLENRGRERAYAAMETVATGEMKVEPLKDAINNPDAVLESKGLSTQDP